jgi:hypothetical protein
MRRTERQGGNLLARARLSPPDVYAASGAPGFGQGAPSCFEGVSLMKTVLKLAGLACLISLGACSKSPAENNAAAIESNFDNAADNMEAMASNTSNDAAADALNNRADRLRDAGDNAADAVRDAGSRSNNVESNTVGM